MTYLISDVDGELLEVLDFETPEQLKAYKQLNPSHIVELAENFEDSILDEDLVDELEEEDSISLW